MAFQTILDYEVFDHLKTLVHPSCSDENERFSQLVLGYGFLAEDEAQLAPVFVLLCRPPALLALQALLRETLPDGYLTFSGFQIPIRVRDSAQRLALVHTLEKQAEAERAPVKSEWGLEPPPEPEDLTEWVQVSLGQTLREVILQDHRKVILPSYLLRYIPFTSPNLVLLRAALSQIHYLHQSGPSAAGEFERRTVSARMTEISRWSSFSRTSIYRLLHEDPRSPWLVAFENKGSYQNEQGQQISQPNEYLLPPLQLTPGDAADLLDYLNTHRADWATLDDALFTLAKTDPREIFVYPYRTPQPGDPESPLTVLEILRVHFGLFALTAERMTLIDKIRDALIGNDFVAVPWYVLRKLLPVYGPSIIGLYLMCQPLLYHNGEVQRNTFWLPGGAASLYDWTGDRSIGKYFPKTNVMGRGRPVTPSGSSDREWRANKRDRLGDFFLRVDTRKDTAGKVQWKIEVQDMPILPEDERRMRTVYTLLATLIQQGQLNPLLAIFDQNPSEKMPPKNTINFLDQAYRLSLPREALKPLSTIALHIIISDFETPERDHISNFETPEERLISLFASPVQQLISESATPALVLFSEFETYLKILFRIKDSIKHFKDSNHLPDSNWLTDEFFSDAPEEGRDGQLSKIVRDLNPVYQDAILKEPQTGSCFKAWLIANCLNSGVTHPVNLAVTQTFQNKANPPQSAVRLAEAPAEQLTVLVRQWLQDPASLSYVQDPERRAWAEDLQILLMGGTPADRSLLLRRLLDFLRPDDRPA